VNVFLNNIFKSRNSRCFMSDSVSTRTSGGINTHLSAVTVNDSVPRTATFLRNMTQGNYKHVGDYLNLMLRQ
jgi:hypothetical protein